MILDEFIKKYNGKGIDYDGAFGNQCMDLYRQYVKEVLGFPQSPAVVGAKDVWDTYLKTHYTKVGNTPEGFPNKGDVIIWGKTYGPFGHIAVCIEADINKLKVFGQNDPLGTLCQERVYNYNHILGWLKPIKEEVMDKVDLGGLKTELEIYGVVELATLKS